MHLAPAEVRFCNELTVVWNGWCDYSTDKSLYCKFFEQTPVDYCIMKYYALFAFSKFYVCNKIYKVIID